MKTLEDRANEYADSVNRFGAYNGYIRGATDQKDIDNTELTRIKRAWENESKLNHNDKANYLQGFHDAVERAISILKGKVDINWFTDKMAR